MPDALFGGWCDFPDGPPSESVCRAAGCRYSSEHSWCDCHYHDKVKFGIMCEKAGGVFQRHTCTEGMHWPHIKEQLEIIAGDTCDGKMTAWYQPMADWVLHEEFTKGCCRSYPATICDPTLEEVSHVCIDKDDFLPHEIMHAWCEFRSAQPTPEQCKEAGCWFLNEHCDCGDDAASCESLGGIVAGLTCSESMSHIGYEELKIISKAKTEGTCTNADGSPVMINDHETLYNRIIHNAKTCCKSSPANICDPTAKLMTTCKNIEDFMPTAIQSSHCHFHHELQPDPNECERAGCKYSDEHCQCHNEAEACKKLGGRFYEHTCLEAAQGEWFMNTLKPIYEAEAQGQCAGIKTPWEEDIASWAKHSQETKKCCKSQPANICEPDLKVMSPCKSDEDFMPDAELPGWCELHQQPTAEVCKEAGCFF